MKIIESARKHDISNKDIEYVYISATQSIVLREDPEKVMLFGFDTIGRALEIGYIINDQGQDIVIHAMKIRQSYKKYLYGRKGV